jgi:hypothetical protein
MKLKVISAATAAAVCVSVLSAGAQAQSESDRIKALEAMIQKQQAQIET